MINSKSELIDYLGTAWTTTHNPLILAYLTPPLKNSKNSVKNSASKTNELFEKDKKIIYNNYTR